MYPPDPQNSLLATTSNNKLGQEEDKNAPPLVEQVYLRVHLHLCVVLEGAPRLIRCPNYERQPRVNNLQSCILDTHTSVHRHWPIINVSAACMGKNASENIATTS